MVMLPRERYISNENNTLYVLYHINDNTNQINYRTDDMSLTPFGESLYGLSRYGFSSKLFKHRQDLHKVIMNLKIS